MMRLVLGAAEVFSRFVGRPFLEAGGGKKKAIAVASTDPDRVVLIEPGDPAETVRLLAAAMTRFARQPLKRRSPSLCREAAIDELRAQFISAQVVKPGEVVWDSQACWAEESIGC